MAHITGGGLPGNVNRVLPDTLDAEIDASSWEVPNLFRQLETAGGVSRAEMYRTFNMGVGMVVITDEASARSRGECRVGPHRILPARAHGARDRSGAHLRGEGMKRHLLVAAGLAVFAVATRGCAGSGDAGLPPGSNTAGIPESQRVAQDACQQAYDVYQFMAPQLGLALAGGNATLGTGSTLGGLGHFSIGVRVNVFKGDPSAGRPVHAEHHRCQPADAADEEPVARPSHRGCGDRHLRRPSARR